MLKSVSSRMRRRSTIVLAGAVLLVGTGTAFAVTDHSNNDWPYSTPSGQPTYTLAAVGDIACEPATDPETGTAVNTTTPASLKCGSASLGGYDAEFSTAAQAAAMHPHAVALLGDEQYEVGKLSDFEQSFEQAWGGLRMLERPAPGNHEYYAYTKKGDNEAGQNGNGYFAYFNGHDESGNPNASGQAGDDSATNQGWYSYNLGKWHIISLNVECNSPAFNNDCSTTDGGLLSQETSWLSSDLTNNTQPCTIAYWHQPAFSSTTTGTAAQASAPGAGGQEGLVSDAWWKLLYANHATLILNGHEHLYARLKPMDPAGNYDPKNGIPEFIVGSGGEALDTLATNADGSYSNPNVVTAQDEAYGVLKLTLKPGGYSFVYQPSKVGKGFPASAMNYSDSGSGSCYGG
ncbi:MAG: metallophosphoesterase family protein [Marmoricola sp.]